MCWWFLSRMVLWFIIIFFWFVIVRKFSPETVAIWILFIRTGMRVDAFFETLDIFALTAFAFEVSFECDLTESNSYPPVKNSLIITNKPQKIIYNY